MYIFLNKKIKQLMFILVITMLSITSFAKGVYLEPEDFLNQVFENNTPKVKKIWLTKDLKLVVKKILGHDLNSIRLRYWADDVKTTWILEEIGRDQPITVGIVVKDEKIERINVLIFRESRGWEVKYPFFTDQFKQAFLLDNMELDKKIDGISGATLSVNALTKLARLALYLDEQVNKQ
jgi:FMN-binding domain